MAYNQNTYFLLFLPVVCLVYQLAPRRGRWRVLLCASLLFFWWNSRLLMGWWLATAATTFLAARRMEALRLAAGAEGREAQELLQRRLRRWCAAGIVPAVGILAVLKYTGFSLRMLNRFAGTGFGPVSFAVPLGISFYTLEAVGYLLDVCWQRIPAEKNFFRHCLFLSFFPVLMEGPILRAGDIRDQLSEGCPITEENLTAGSLRILWGLMKRMLVSDRLHTMVVSLFDERESGTGLMVLFTMFVVTMQLYLEFSGTIDIVIGSARLFGVRLPENFRQPFFAKSAAEFWRRWHISLGGWLKNYVFYPVSTSRPVKRWGRWGRKHCSRYVTSAVTSLLVLTPVWLLNGLWHGPRETYILFGVYYLIVLQAEVMLKPLCGRVLGMLRIPEESRGLGFFRMVRTWGIILLGETLFRADSWGHFLKILEGLFRSPWHGGIPRGQLIELGLDAGDLAVAAAGLVLTAVIDWKTERNPAFWERIAGQGEMRRFLLLYVMVMLLVIFGAYGAGYTPADLIYAGF